MDVAKAVADIKGGKIEFRVDRQGNLSFLFGKLSFDAKALEENFKAVADEIRRLKPSTIKGRYITKVTVTSTMAPGVPVDIASIAAWFIACVAYAKAWLVRSKLSLKLINAENVLFWVMFSAFFVTAFLR